MTDVRQYDQIIGEVTTVFRSDRKFSLDHRVFRVSGIEMDDAISMARNQVEYTTTGSFEQRKMSSLPYPNPFGALARPLLPMERSDRA